MDADPCAACGTEFARPSARFCGRCGAPRTASSDASAGQTAAPPVAPAASERAAPPSPPSPPDDAAEQAVFHAFEEGARWAALDDRFIKVTEFAMSLVGFELVA